MQNKYLYVAVFMAAALTLNSCNSDDVVEQRKQSNEYPIGFTMLEKNAVVNTRTVESLTEQTLLDFEVWAYQNTKTTDNGADAYSIYMGAATDGVQIVRATASGNGVSNQQQTIGTTQYYGWGYKIQSELNYWPSNDLYKDNALQFIALAPAHDGEAALGQTPTKTDAKQNVTYSNMNFGTYVPSTGVSFTYTSPTDESNQRDIMVAAAKQGYAANAATVSFPFKHALAQVVFDGKVNSDESNYTFYIQEIQLCNIATTGTCTIKPNASGELALSANGSTANTTIVWSADASSKATNGVHNFYAVDTKQTDGKGTMLTFAANQTTPAPLSTSSSTKKCNLMLIPQQVTGWTGSGDPAATAAANTGAYLKITYSVKNGNVWFKGRSESEGTVTYIPFSDQTGGSGWQPGFTYTYTLNFGLGKTADGQASGGTLITFQLSAVTGWQSTSTQNVTL